jgi:nitrate reductase NapAB chaperone NapD
MREEVHISSLIVQGMPACLPAIRAAMTAMDGVEIHAEGDGKLVVVM